MLLNKIIFDMDGVITTEQNYWTASALTVWQWCYGYTPRMEQRAYEIRSKVFCDDRLIILCKNLGINSNWDITFVTYVFAKLFNTEDNFELVYTRIKELNMDALGLYACMEDKGYSRGGSLWNEMRDVFQQWYLGDELYEEQYGKHSSHTDCKGLVKFEQPLFEMDKLHTLLKGLKEDGYTLAIATGRISAELIPPLKAWGFYEYFEPDSVITYDYVEQAEKSTGQTLTKPHPYMFVKAALGADFPDEDIVEGKYDKQALKDVLAVGDAGADMYSAQGAGMRFVSVLTGVAGESARGFFEQNNADAVLSNVLELPKWLKK